MKSQILDDILVMNQNVSRTELLQRIFKIVFPFFIIGLAIRFFVRPIILKDIVWIVDFAGIAPFIQGFLLSMALGYYTQKYGDRPWSFISFLKSFVGLSAIIAVARCFIYVTIGALIMVALGVELDGEEQQLFFQNNFWLDILPMITDTILVFYFFNPIPRKNA